MGRRKTIELDEDVAARLEEEAARSQRSVDEVGNEALRETLHLVPPTRFRVHPRNLGVRPGINFDCAWKLLDEIKSE